MRRFEFVEGSSAKFWSADVDGAKFIVVYGKIGTAGSRKEKEFPSAEAAFREYEKKVAEKTREGYQEVAGDGAPPPVAPPATEEKREAKKAGPAPWPARAARVEGATEAKAIEALQGFERALAESKHSWRHKRAARAARRALAGLGGAPVGDELSAALTAMLGRVGQKKGPSLLRALDLLWALDVGAYERALAAWRGAQAPSKQVQLLTRLAEQFPEPELAFRLGSLLVDRPGRGLTGTEQAWGRRWKDVAPRLSAQLTQQGTTLRKFLQTLDSAGDAALASRVARMKES